MTPSRYSWRSSDARSKARYSSTVKRYGWRGEARAMICSYVCTTRSAQALVPHQLTQDAGGAGFIRALGFEFPGKVVGQFDYTVALRLVGVVVGHVQPEVGEHLIAIHVLHQLH